MWPFGHLELVVRADSASWDFRALRHLRLLLWRPSVWSCCCRCCFLSLDWARGLRHCSRSWGLSVLVPGSLTTGLDSRQLKAHYCPLSGGPLARAPLFLQILCRAAALLAPHISVVDGGAGNPSRKKTQPWDSHGREIKSSRVYRFGVTPPVTLLIFGKRWLQHL